MKALGRVKADLALGLCQGTVDLRPADEEADKLDDGKLAPLITALRTSAFTGALDLSDNGITEQGILQLAEVLGRVPGTSTCNVSELRLGGNPIRSRGAHALAQVV